MFFKIFYEAKIRQHNILFIKAYSLIENIDINPILTYTEVFKKHMKEQKNKLREGGIRMLSEENLIKLAFILTYNKVPG